MGSPSQDYEEAKDLYGNDRQSKNDVKDELGLR